MVSGNEMTTERDTIEPGCFPVESAIFGSGCRVSPASADGISAFSNGAKSTKSDVKSCRLFASNLNLNFHVDHISLPCSLSSHSPVYLLQAKIRSQRSC